MCWTLQLVGLTTVVAVGVINGGRVALAVAVAEAVALAEGSGLADGSAAAGVGVSGVVVTFVYVASSSADSARSFDTARSVTTAVISSSESQTSTTKSNCVCSNGEVLKRPKRSETDEN